MKASRRMKRMTGKKKTPGLSLVSLMDVFTILVFFLLTNSASDEILKDPKDINLPEAVVESKPKETIVIFVSPNEILMQGEHVMNTSDALAQKKDVLIEVKNRLLAQRDNVIGTSTKSVADSKKVRGLTTKSIPLKLLREVMATSIPAVYGKISISVIQKSSQQ